MAQFGYTLQRSQAVRLGFDAPQLAAFVERREPTLRLCISCGACTASCTGGQHGRLEMHRVHLALRRGIDKELEPALAQCHYCGKCQLVCPRGVNNRNVIRLIWEGLAKADKRGAQRP